MIGHHPVTDLMSPPVLQVSYDSGTSPAEDLSDHALSAGQGTEGNQFELVVDGWQFNLQTRNYTALRTYTVKMVSGDGSEYVIEPS